MPDNHFVHQSTEDGRSFSVLQEFLEKVKNRLMPAVDYLESESAYRLRCPSGECGDEEPNFILYKDDGTGY